MWRQAWAKASRQFEGQQLLWLPLVTHLTDSGAVMRLLWDEWVGPGPRAVIEADIGDAELARDVAILAASLHDLGKFSRAFAGQVPAMRTHMEEHGFRWDPAAVEDDSRRLPHAVIGHVFVRDLIVSRGGDSACADAFAVVIGGHHGVPPVQGQLNAVDNNPRLVGDAVWKEGRAGLTEHVLAELNLRKALSAAGRTRLSDASQMLLTALVITADWIASNADLFPLVPMPAAVSETSDLRAARAWRILGLLPRWQPTDECLSEDATTLLRSRFRRASAYEANDVQRLALQAARDMPDAGLLIIEAVMGVGKTEASLLASEVLARRFGRSGIFYGLPTRATTDAMFTRSLDWWRGLPDRNDSGNRSIQLRHSGAPLNGEFRSLPRAGTHEGRDGPFRGGAPAGVGRDEPRASQWGGRRSVDVEAVAHHWTSGRKKAALADAVIATIDHELLAALASRHVVLRHLGLARQVVVLDEIHAADAWMRVYLLRALEWLGRYGVPVVALSATLPPQQRTELVQAYEKGRRAGLPEPEAALDPVFGLPSRSASARPPALPEAPATDEYPLLTYIAKGEVTQLSARPAGRQTIWLEWLSDDIDTLSDLLGVELSDGGCAVIVCNTVNRARERYHSLRDRFGDRVHLAHSRFIGHDRARNDQWLVETFGRARDGAFGDDRDGRIVVATQVVEQSLDIDFDLMVSDLAPIDLILQRIGRLHRHDRGEQRPHRLRRPRCLVTAFDPDEGPDLHAGAARIYGEHLLLRSAALVNEVVDAGGSVVLPDDVPVLVRRCYGDERLGPQAWREFMREAAAMEERRRAKTASNARTYRLRAPGERATVLELLAVNAGEADTEVSGSQQVREGDGGFEVLLLERADDGLRLLPHLGDDRHIPTDVRPDPETTRLLAQCMVRVPGWVTNTAWGLNAVLDDLGANYHSSWQKDPVLGGQLVLALDPGGHGRMGPFDVYYDPVTGLEVSRDRT